MSLLSGGRCAHPVECRFITARDNEIVSYKMSPAYKLMATLSLSSVAMLQMISSIQRESQPDALNFLKHSELSHKLG